MAFRPAFQFAHVPSPLQTMLLLCGRNTYCRPFDIFWTEEEKGKGSREIYGRNKMLCTLHNHRARRMEKTPRTERKKIEIYKIPLFPFLSFLQRNEMKKKPVVRL
ncbi:hypothetical protein CDAR_378901 [Caerostris darwini]|uniref:Secreted protein n=1 Tax=Caerostris darwini TaxID=1538125 RepID=A0AAV4TW93_9ARAC|nr:hypothetical protein CDAR_378901 [Caerostris darwini]